MLHEEAARQLALQGDSVAVLGPSRRSQLCCEAKQEAGIGTRVKPAVQLYPRLERWLLPEARRGGNPTRLQPGALLDPWLKQQA